MKPEPEQHRAASPSEARRTGGAATRTLREVASLYRRAFRAALRPIRSAEAEAHRLHVREREGVSGETPYIALLGLALFLLSVYVAMLGVALAAYYLA